MSHRKRSADGRARGATDRTPFERALLGLEESPRKPFDARQDRKTLQLCRQVERALMLALAGECADDTLREVMIASVEPLGGAAQLLVRVLVRAGAGASIPQVHARLVEHQGRLRAVVARSICRKRTPVLSFVVLPAPSAQEGGDDE
ncbi:MAG TPA: hypothetical protein VLJ39_15605 [Tepidisphaeraceae bacterium]|nr:hypothetical protein [Tepidisphaeraceae bacterium]